MPFDMLIVTAWLGVACGMTAIACASVGMRAYAWVLGILSLLVLVPSLTWLFILVFG